MKMQCQALLEVWSQGSRSEGRKGARVQHAAELTFAALESAADCSALPLLSQRGHEEHITSEQPVKERKGEASIVNPSCFPLICFPHEVLMPLHFGVVLH